MLAIRFLRSGRKNRAFFRIVLTENSKPPKSNYVKELGWFDPHSKQTSLKTEEILKYLDHGAKPSNSVAKLLIANKIKHKQVVFVPDAPKKKKSKGDEPKEKATSKPETAAEPAEKVEEPAQPSEEPEEAKTKEVEEKEPKAEDSEKSEPKEENQPEADKPEADKES